MSKKEIRLWKTIQARRALEKTPEVPFDFREASLCVVVCMAAFLMSIGCFL